MAHTEFITGLLLTPYKKKRVNYEAWLRNKLQKELIVYICKVNEAYDESTCRDKVKQLVKLHKKIVGDISIQWKVFTKDACRVLFKLEEFKAAYRLKPQHVLDLVLLPQEARVSDEGEAFVDQKVKLALKASKCSLLFCCEQAYT